ncbi:uncharacterized protein CDAR_576761 [Caerostris darwini]|uniref:Gustatory receptor n=1 Tax=Caerostris darwini TaxID=1538125 RepID=A0AAV4WMS1_9ARAC|nr:uncharacterized protein CDAR_576761 [Caerostris darwini]
MQIFEAYKKLMTSKPDPDYKFLLAQYSYLRKLVTSVDRQLNCLVFWAAFASLFSLYFALAMILESPRDLFNGQIISQVLVIIYDTVMFFLMCLWADKMSMSSTAVASEAHWLEENSRMSPVLQIRYLLAVNQDMNFTVWGFLPLRKGFILGSIGTIITYSVLINNLIN